MPYPSSNLPTTANVLKLDVEAMSERSVPAKSQLFGYLRGAIGSGTITKIRLDNAAPDYVVLTYGADNEHERVWARSRHFVNGIEYHLTDDTAMGFPGHTRDVR